METKICLATKSEETKAEGSETDFHWTTLGESKGWTGMQTDNFRVEDFFFLKSHFFANYVSQEQDMMRDGGGGNG